jgi:flagella basal body P-ring formation protein FlgA
MKLPPANRLSLSACSGLFPGICLVGILFAQLARGENAPGESATNTAPVVQFQLRAAALVGGEGLFLSQIIEAPLDLPRLRLGDAPEFGKTVILKRAEVAELARAAGLDQTLTNWAGPVAVRISRRSRVLAEKEVLQRLTPVLQKQFVKEQGELQLRLAQPLAAITIPDEAFVIKVLELPTSGVISAFIVRFEIQTAQGETVGSWQASLLAKVCRDIWVATSAMKRGDPVRGIDLTRERRDVLLCGESLAEFVPDDPALEFAGPVQAGAPIWARLLRQKPVVHRGQRVVAMVKDGALQIILKVEALEDGAAGQIIRIRNPLSQRDLRAKVVDEQNVLVSM